MVSRPGIRCDGGGTKAVAGIPSSRSTGSASSRIDEDASSNVTATWPSRCASASETVTGDRPRESTLTSCRRSMSGEISSPLLG